jgi:hypothetical protein
MCIASKIGVLDDQNGVYISTPRPIIDDYYLIQGHTLKHDDSGNLVFFLLGYINEFPLPNLELHLYNCQEITFPLVSQEEAYWSNVSGRITRSSKLLAVAVVATTIRCRPQARHMEWSPIE